MAFNLIYISRNSVFLFMLLLSCNSIPEKQYDVSIEVTTTAYNSVENQTKKGKVGLTAWGDTLVPGEKAIAVSRDLIKKGLVHNTQVEIEGLEGVYFVKDKMNKRWKNRIDIYMGMDRETALEWGKQNVEIKFDTIKR
jgi:3D (Asp-Asp-Asp) domain-containing protein